jgi:DNA recombination protein RmuC
MITTILLFLILCLLLLQLYLGTRRNNLGPISNELTTFKNDLSKIDPLIRDEFQRNRGELNGSLLLNRNELAASFKALQETLSQDFKTLKTEQQSNSLAQIQKQEEIKKDTETYLKEIRLTVEGKLEKMNSDNQKKLDDIQGVVDKKLEESLDKKFNESFKMISERLEKVHQGLGEMQNLATGVGDLKKVLTNVKTRGVLGEIQLGSILEEIFSTEQYITNANVGKGTQERVEFAIKFPNQGNGDLPLLLPIDSKFPVEDYHRLQEAQENRVNMSPKEFEVVLKQFENAVKKNAKDIRDKYINPPVTTDFAIMFVPTEGLYAEILRSTGLQEELQRTYKVTVVGPTNLTAFLTSLQMGFRTLAIEKRSGEVWDLLGAIKTEFGEFGNVLDKTSKKLQEASNVIVQAGVRSRAIEKKLKTVHQLPIDVSRNILDDIPKLED